MLWISMFWIASFQLSKSQMEMAVFTVVKMFLT